MQDVCLCHIKRVMSTFVFLRDKGHSYERNLFRRERLRIFGAICCNRETVRHRGSRQCQIMLTLHYYSNSESVRAALRQVTAAWWSQDDDPVYSIDLIKEFEMENPPLEDELSWILSKGIARDIITRLPSCKECRGRINLILRRFIL